jgi:hypothetical protein
MSISMFRRLTPALLFVGATLACAQTAPRGRTDPLDAAASTPRLVYQSPLAEYRRFADQPVGSWRSANETVNRVGGWRVYAREAAEPPAAPASAPKQPAPSTAPAAHGGHEKK